jgi:dihydrofolate reductase
VIVSEFVSLDGVIEDPRWTFRFMSEEQERFKFDELSASDALLLGRMTYEGFAVAWPNMMEQYEGPHRAELGEYTDMMNGYPKYVVSTTLEEPLEWSNSSPIKDNVAEKVSTLTQQPGKDILVSGSSDLVNTPMQHGLIDEYHLMVFPSSWVAENGSWLLKDNIETTVLRLVETKTFGSGVGVLFYRPTVEKAEG